MSFQGDGGNNYEVFRECVSGSIVERSTNEAKKPARAARRKKAKKRAGTEEVVTDKEQDPEELADFIDFIASETFSALPEEVQSLSYSAIERDDSLARKYKDPMIPRSLLESLTAAIPVAVSESLVVYGIIPESTDLPDFLRPILSDYISSVTTGPPVWATTRTAACEICDRDWIPLSYHHLIPRKVHAKVLKRGWHEEWKLNSVAWLCRACHSFVHRMASNEELAREWYTVDRILQREDVQDWAKWVGRVRWKAR